MSERDRDGTRLLRPDEVAERLGVGVRTVYKMFRKAPFKRKLSHRIVRYEESGLERWIDSKRPKN